MFSLFKKAPHADAAHAIHGAIVARARSPGFYRHAGVADTVDGRFEVLALHVALVIHRLQGDLELVELGQALFEVMVDNLDHGLRLAGLGDLRVGKRVKTMVAAFYGRLQAYGGALDPAVGGNVLRLVLERNLYRDSPPPPPALAAVEAYVRAQFAGLIQANRKHLLAGRLDLLPFADVPA